MNLKTAIRYKESETVAFVGAGGKTTAMFLLARELGTSVIVTASTHLMQNQISLADKHFIVKTKADIVNKTEPNKNEVTLFCGEINDDGRVSGLTIEILDELNKISKANDVPLLLEADGSRRLPIKAPDIHEPPVPPWTENVVVCVGLSALDKKISETIVHRPQLFSKIVGKEIGENIENIDVIKLLSSEQGGLKNIPKGAKKIALLNQADDTHLVSRAENIADELIKYYDTVIISSLPGAEENKLDSLEIVKHDLPVIKRYEKSAGVILAAGGSSRYGEPKQMLYWRGKPLIRHVAENALNAGLDPVIIVTGAVIEEIQETLQDLPIKMVINPSWREGQSTSLRTGIKSIEEYVGSAVMLLSDQPQIKSDLIRALVSEHRETQNKIIAPYVGKQRANPVLFDRDLFSELMKIKGDVGGRVLFDRYPVSKIAWKDKNILFDIDTPEDFNDFKRSK